MKSENQNDVCRSSRYLAATDLTFPGMRFSVAVFAEFWRENGSRHPGTLRRVVAQASRLRSSFHPGHQLQWYNSFSRGIERRECGGECRGSHRKSKNGSVRKIV